MQFWYNQIKLRDKFLLLKSAPIFTLLAKAISKQIKVNSINFQDTLPKMLKNK